MTNGLHAWSTVEDMDQIVDKALGGIIVRLHCQLMYDPPLGYLHGLLRESINTIRPFMNSDNQTVALLGDTVVIPVDRHEVYKGCMHALRHCPNIGRKLRNV
jgi:hypothetical protein